jgi:hypothetical protein
MHRRAADHRITPEQAPAALDPAQTGRGDGKTVITL